MIINYQDILLAFIGGVMIGLAVTIMLLFKGRVAGVSGILYRFVTMEKGEWPWRGFFVVGLVAGGFILQAFQPQVMANTLDRSFLQLVLAGFLVGFGTLLGNGCTSGHGVCGISRLSMRSLIATGAFMFSGILTVVIMRLFFLG